MDALLDATLIGAAFLALGCAQNGDSSERPHERRRSPDTRRAVEREEMVTSHIASRGISDPLVLAAMRSVPRERFVPRGVAPDAYQDSALPIGADQTISQPYIVALMTEAAGLAYGEKVLEVGTGSGYQAAVLAEITPHVYSIEIIEELASGARAVLDALGYDEVETRVGDGYAGWPEQAPFDAIVVTAAPDHVPQALVDQLAVGGRLCIPVGGQHEIQSLTLIIRREDGSLDRRVISPVRFVPMTGEAQLR
jgi:protein-L-isoaspartate(D-aspartate) O-methyltransferase